MNGFADISRVDLIRGEFLMKIFAALSLMVGFVLFPAPGHAGNVDLVKSGVLKFNQSLTVGEAFGGWANCAATEWRQFETARGQRVVESVCSIKDAKPFTMKILASKVVGNISGADHLSKFSGAKALFQWTINKDGSFQLARVEVRYDWSDGKSYHAAMGLKDALTNLFNNEVDFDLRILDGLDSEIGSEQGLAALKTASAYHQLMYALYERAE